MSAADKAYAAPDKRCRVGILYVHGIGEQKKGEVASALAEACHSWIRDRISGIGAGHCHRGTTRETLESLVPKLAETPPPNASRGDLRQYLAFLNCAHLFIPAAKLPGGKVAIPALEGEPLLASAELVAVPSHESEPAAFRLELDWTDARGQQHASDWLIAESWWADECAAPSIWQLLKWAPRAVPVTIAAHLFARAPAGFIRNEWQRRRLEMLGTLYTAVACFASIFLVPLLYIGVIMIGFCSWLPTSRSKEAAQDIRFLLTRVLGDAFVFSNSSAQHTTIMRRVQRDLDWLIERCTSIIVVGHSQGAMLAYLACRSRADNVQKLITLGSGIRKLRALANVARGPDLVLSGAETLLMLANVAGMGAWISIALGLTGQVSILTVIVGALVGAVVAATVGLYGFAVFATEALHVPPEDRFWEARIMRDFAQSIRKAAGGLVPPIMWSDFVATRDPVAAGPTYSAIQVKWMYEAGPELRKWPPSFIVTNARSILFDHTGYLKNRDECVATLVHEAGTSDGEENFNWLVPDFHRTCALSLEWAPASVPPIGHARARIFARASLATHVLIAVIIAFIVVHFASGLVLPAHWSWHEVWRALGFGWRDLGLAIVLVSAWVGVRAAKTYALERLARAIFERRNWTAKLNSDDTIRLVDDAFSAYSRGSLGESLGLAVSVLLPAIILAIAQAADGPTAVIWTIITVAVAHSITAILRLHQNKIDLQHSYGTAQRGSAGDSSASLSSAASSIALAPQPRPVDQPKT